MSNWVSRIGLMTPPAQNNRLLTRAQELLIRELRGAGCVKDTYCCGTLSGGRSAFSSPWQCRRQCSGFGQNAENSNWRFRAEVGDPSETRCWWEPVQCGTRLVRLVPGTRHC